MADQPKTLGDALPGGRGRLLAAGFFVPALAGALFTLVDKKVRADRHGRLQWALATLLDQSEIPRGEILDLLVSLVVYACQFWGATKAALFQEIEEQWPPIAEGLTQARANEVARQAHERDPSLSVSALWAIDRAYKLGLSLLEGREEEAGRVAEANKDAPDLMREALLQAGVAIVRPDAPASPSGDAAPAPAAAQEPVTPNAEAVA